MASNAPARPLAAMEKKAVKMAHGRPVLPPSPRQRPAMALITIATGRSTMKPLAQLQKAALRGCVGVLVEIANVPQAHNAAMVFVFPSPATM
jgi:hypothetical protein